MVRARIRRFLASAFVDGVVRTIVVVSVIGSGFAVVQNRELTRCVAAYNNANNARSVALTEATDQERKAERKADDAQSALFLSPVLNKPSAEQTPAERAEVLRLFRAYQLALTEQSKERSTADDSRRDHPIPPPPDEICD